MRILKLAVLGLALGLASAVSAEDVVLNPEHPDTYKVKRGDTLWDISARFLRDPWMWPSVWDFNPQIENPHLIYPGDVIRLAYDASGKPVITVTERVRRTEDVPTERVPMYSDGTVAPPDEPERRRIVRGPRSGNRLYPRIRRLPLDEAIPTIPEEIIRQFTSRPMVVTEEDLNNSGYVVHGQEERLIAGLNDKVYARNLEAGRTNRFSLYRTGKVYRNPGAKNSEDILGYEAIYVGSALALEFGDPSTLAIVESKRETLLGDRIMPIPVEDLGATFLPRAPEVLVEGQIIDLMDAVARIGQYQTAVINLGRNDGLEPGHVLAVFRQGQEIRDVVSEDPQDTVRIPDERSGLMMIFRSYDRVSYGLIMNSTKDIALYDVLRNP